MKQSDTMKYALAGLAFALFLGLTIWFVRNEGRRTRESLREAAKDGGNEIRKGLVEGAERVVDRAADVPGKIVHDVTKKAGQVSRNIAGEVKDILHGPAKPEAKPPLQATHKQRPAVADGRNAGCCCAEWSRADPHATDRHATDFCAAAPHTAEPHGTGARTAKSHAAGARRVARCRSTVKTEFGRPETVGARSA